MLIIELFCGAGLVAEGLKRAGCTVIGIDIVPQPRYPGPFIQMDALKVDPRLLAMADGFWASPPCLRDTVLNVSARREESHHGRVEKAHPDLIGPTRKLLEATGKPYTIENVMGAPLINPVMLCGSMFDLGYTDRGIRHHLERHRIFETNWPLEAPGPCRHLKPVIGVYGAHARRRAASAGGRTTRDDWEHGHNAAMAGAMGISRPMTCAEISQGIPPAYAEWVASEMMLHLERRRWGQI